MRTHKVKTSVNNISFSYYMNNKTNIEEDRILILLISYMKPITIYFTFLSNYLAQILTLTIVNNIRLLN